MPLHFAPPQPPVGRTVDTFNFRQSIYTKKQPYEQYPPVRLTLVQLQDNILSSSSRANCRWVESIRGDTVVKHCYDFEQYHDHQPSEEEMGRIYQEVFLGGIRAAYSETRSFDVHSQVATLSSHGWVPKAGGVDVAGVPSAYKVFDIEFRLLIFPS
jgi:hypothetical protein